MHSKESSKHLNILIVEDVGSDAELIQLALAGFDYTCQFEVCSTRQRYSELLRDFSPDIILSDFSLPGFNGMTALTQLRESDDVTPFIFVTGTLTEDNAVEAIRVGVTDFILKKNLDHLPAALLRALREKNEKVGRKEALEELQASERRFKSLVQEGSDLIGILDTEANYLFVSESSERILDIKPEYFIGKNAFDFIHPEDHQWVRRLFESITDHKRVNIGPFRFKDGEGKWRWIETVATNTLTDPAINGVTVNSRDITERIEREEALVISNERYRLASLATKDIIYDWELTNNRVTRMGNGIARLFGYTENELQSDPGFWEEHIHPDDREAAYHKLNSALNNKQESFCEHEYRFKKSDGTFVYVYDKGYIIRDKKGKAIRLVGALQDITEQKNLLAQKELIGFLRQELGKPNSFSYSIRLLLKLIVDYSGVDLGELWMTSIDGSHLDLVGHFSRRPEVEEFYHIGRQRNWFKIDEGFPGEVLKAKQFRVWDNIPANKQFHRRIAARKTGLKMAYGTPIFHGPKVIGTLLLFGAEPHHNLTDLSSILSVIGIQLGSDIQRKKIEDELNSFFDLSHDIMCIAGSDGYLKKVNPAFSKILGYTTEELLQTPYLEFTHPEDREKIKHEFLTLSQGLSSQNFETRYITKDQRQVWLSWSATPLPEQKLVYAVAKDITEKKKTEQAMEKLLSQLKTAQQIAQIGYWTHDFGTKKAQWTDEMFTIWEQDPKIWKPTFRNLSLTVHPDDRHQLLGLDTSLFKGAKSTVKEYRIKTPSGKTKWISEIITLYKDTKGKATKMDGVAQDITRRKNLELLYREIGRLARVGAWELDLDKQTLFWSSITKEIHEVEADYEPDLSTAINFYKKGESRDRIQQCVDLAIKNKVSYDVELQIVTAKGNERWIRSIGKPEFHKGKCVRLLGSFQDIHARKVAEEHRKEILESITDGFFAVDGNWKVVFWNSPASQILNLKNSKDIVGQNLWDHLSSRQYVKFKDLASTALHRQEALVSIEKLDPQGKWLEISFFPKSGGLSVYMKDITNEIQQRAQIEQIKNNLDSIINSTNDLIFSVDANMHLISANSAFRERLGSLFSSTVEVGQPIDSPAASDYTKLKWAALITRALKGEQFTVTEEDVVDGQTFYSLVSFNPLMENGTCVGTACFVKDITERTLHLKAIEEQNQRLRDIAWMQSHVVRAPVARIMGLIDLVAKTGDDVSEVTKLLGYVDFSAKELDTIIRDITKKTQEVNLLDLIYSRPDSQ